MVSTSRHCLSYSIVYLLVTVLSGIVQVTSKYVHERSTCFLRDFLCVCLLIDLIVKRECFVLGVRAFTNNIL